MQEITLRGDVTRIPQMHQADFKMLRNADVQVKQIVNEKKQNEAQIIINDTWQHRFPATSRVSKHLDVMTPKDLQERMTGGSYFIVDDQLVDWRDGLYPGFIHEDEAIAKFMEVLGFQTQSDQLLHRGGRGSSRSKRDGNESNIVLKKLWNKSEIVIPGYAAGNEYSSQLSFTWNPFVKTVNSAFDLVRQICTNGMVGMTSFLNTKVPLFNRWEEHLDIASAQIQNKVNSIVVNRIGAMANERASLADCLLLETHVYDRLQDGGAKDLGERERLLGLLEAVSPEHHLAHVYKFDVFQDKRIAAQLPSHLTNLDTFNIATELRTHTSASRKSSDNAMDKFANSVLFDQENQFVGAKVNASGLAAFSDPEAAFFGRMGISK